MTKKYAFTIEPGLHAKLSASSADRWATCAGSVALSVGLPNYSSKYAAEGTAAHWIANDCLQRAKWLKTGTYWIPSPHVYVGNVALVEGFEIDIDEELTGSVAEYFAYIQENEEPGDVVMNEQSFTEAMRKLDPEFGGSTDRLMWREREKLLRVYDYKHGAGVPVDVDDNRQLKYYALGALLSNPQWAAETVELVIAQPRCDHEQGRIRKYVMDAFELVDYAGELQAAAAKTREFGADLVPSKKACRFCPAMKANKCPKVDVETHAIVAGKFAVIDAKAYSVEQIAEFLAKAPLVEERISAVREFAYQRALRGEQIPGFKIVDKRPTRKWNNTDAVTTLLSETREAFTQPELRSPAQIEKLVGKKAFAELEQYVVKQSSGTTLAPESDPRPPAQVAQLTHFKDVS